MHVYSQNIIEFSYSIKAEIKAILRNEVGLKIFGDRFYNKQQTTSYPLKVVIFNNKSMLGYFNPEFFEIGLHERLMYSSKLQLRNVIKHEIAHYMTFINYGANVQHHGHEFKEFCRSMNWGEDVSDATVELEGPNPIPQFEDSAILRKIQKLLSLSNSSNTHEAELAMIKSQQLLLKHNIDSRYFGAEEEKIYLKRIMKQKKENAKMRAIANILETFFVSIVYSRSSEYIYLEILGTAVNIEIAEYVAEILDKEFETLWKQAKDGYGLKGQIAKNSFFMGISKGYCNKVQALKREYSVEVSSALIVIEKQLKDMKAMVYSRLRSTKSFGRHCRESSQLGEKAGNKLNINPGINNKAKKAGFLLSFFGRS